MKKYLIHYLKVMLAGAGFAVAIYAILNIGFGIYFATHEPLHEDIEVAPQYDPDEIPWPYITTIDAPITDYYGIIQGAVITDPDGIQHEYTAVNQEDLAVQRRVNPFEAGATVSVVPLENEQAMIYQLENFDVDLDAGFDSLRYATCITYPYLLVAEDDVIDAYGLQMVDITDAWGCYPTQSDDGSLFFVIVGGTNQQIEAAFDTMIEESWDNLDEEGRSIDYTSVIYHDGSLHVLAILTPEMKERMQPYFDVIMPSDFNIDDPSIQFDYKAMNE